MWDWGILPWFRTVPTSSLGGCCTSPPPATAAISTMDEEYTGHKNQYYLIINFSRKKRPSCWVVTQAVFYCERGKKKIIKNRRPSIPHPPEICSLDHTHTPGSAFLRPGLGQAGAARGWSFGGGPAFFCVCLLGARSTIKTVVGQRFRSTSFSLSTLKKNSNFWRTKIPGISMKSKWRNFQHLEFQHVLVWLGKLQASHFVVH